MTKTLLNNIWAFWIYDKTLNSNNKLSWKDSLYKICDIDSIESFWTLQHKFKPVDRLTDGNTYFFFKKDIYPMWEDPINNKGGSWTLILSSEISKLSNKWEILLIALISDQLGEDNDEISGTLLSIKYTNIKLQIWTKTITNTNSIINIGNMVKSIFQSDLNNCIYFTSHYDVEYYKRNATKLYKL